MLRAMLRLALICAGTLILSFLVVFFLRQTGLRQVFAPPPHPWFAEPQWTILSLTMDELCRDDLEGVEPTTILRIEPTFTESKWVMSCPEPVELAAFLQKSKHRRWILEINSQNNQVISALMESLEKLSKDFQLAASSRSQRTIRQLRKEAPEWLFASDASTLTRLHLFSAFWLETAFDFWPDFVISEATSSSAFHLSEREATELNRRNKRILWNQINSGEQKPPYAVHGVMTDQRKLP